MSDTSPSSAAEHLEAKLQSLGDPQRAGKEKAYLKSSLTHIGVKVPLIRRETRSALKMLDGRGRAAVLAFAQELWRRSLHETRVAAVEALIAEASLLESRDMKLLERFIGEAKTWALVDGLAVSVVGPLIDNHPDALPALDRWATDRDFWIRRAAMLALLKRLRAGGGDFERFSRYADPMLEEKEFFIRKAIGWILRETSKKRPEIVYAWLLPRARAASGVTVREAVRYLDPSQSQDVMRAYEEGRRTSGPSRRNRPRK